MNTSSNLRPQDHEEEIGGLDQLQFMFAGHGNTLQSTRYGVALKSMGWFYVGGRPIHPDSINKRFAKLNGKAKLPPIRHHDPRHTHETLALKEEVHHKVVAVRLGH